MFIVNDFLPGCKTLKIEFSKQRHQVLWIEDGKVMGNNSGRYNTCCCISCMCASPMGTCNGKALLNPHDQLDRVLGKKIALTKAMIAGYTTYRDAKKVKIPIYHPPFKFKQQRTKIWKAFHEWVESWENKEVELAKKCGACGRNTATEDGECVDCRH